VGKSLYGIFNSVSKISGSIGKVVATLSEDRGYIKERQKRCIFNRFLFDIFGGRVLSSFFISYGLILSRLIIIMVRTEPRHLGDAIAIGAHDLGYSLADGLYGVVRAI